MRRRFPLWEGLWLAGTGVWGDWGGGEAFWATSAPGAALWPGWPVSRGPSPGESGPGSGWVENAPSRHTQRMYSTDCVKQVDRVLTRLGGRVGAPGWEVVLLQEELVLCRVWAPGRGLAEKESRNVSGVAGVTHGKLGGGRMSHTCEGSSIPVGKESRGS